MTVVPTTLASHTTLFTGLYPHHHGVARNGFRVVPELQMLAEIMHDEGFRTVGFIPAVPLSDEFGFAQGFDYYDEIGRDVPAETMTDTVTQYLDDNGMSDPTFLFVHYFDPHHTYRAPAPYERMYDRAGRRGIRMIKQLINGNGMTPEERDRAARRHEYQYAAEISYMDEHVGRLLDDLRDRGALDSALVVITSDHGENLWDHPDWFNHGLTVYQSSLHAVCLMRLPGGRLAGTRVSELVASIDVFPTILKFFGITLPGTIDGEAIDLPNVEKGFPKRVRFAQATKPRSERVESGDVWTNYNKSRCIRDGRYKFVQTPFKNTEEFYDLVADPGETNNLMADLPRDLARTVADMRERLEAWAHSARPPASAMTKSEEALKKLRSLGYVR